MFFEALLTLEMKKFLRDWLFVVKIAIEMQFLSLNH